MKDTHWKPATGHLRRCAKRALAAWVLAGVAATALCAPEAKADDRGAGGFDTNDNGLVEIVDIEDLNEIREYITDGTFYGWDGTQLGCPNGACDGFELAADLDFDPNDDGLDPSDPYYNGGEGWFPIASDPLTPFTGTFVGSFNGTVHVISNLSCRNESGGQVALCSLFGHVSGATLSDVHLERVSMSAQQNSGAIASVLTDSILEKSSATGFVGPITGLPSVGGLVGEANGSIIDECYAHVGVVGHHSNGGLVGRAVGTTIQRSFATGRVLSGRQGRYSGGIAGSLEDSAIIDCFSTGNVGKSRYTGGLVGFADAASSVERSFSTGYLVGAWQPQGGLIGGGDAAAVFQSYWASDLSGLETSYGGEGYLAWQLQCGTPAQSGSCGQTNQLFLDWDQPTNSNGGALWDMGTTDELPGLNIQGTLFRDSDGDGVLDGEDDFPLEYAAATDTDGDGAVDSWKEGCDETCQTSSGLVLDQFTTNRFLSVDLDLDGQPDAWNPGCPPWCPWVFPLDDSVEVVPGEADADSNGLIDIEDWEELDAIRYQSHGHGQLMAASERKFRDDSIDQIYDADTSGCPPRLLLENLAKAVADPGDQIKPEDQLMIAPGLVLTQACRGYELRKDLDFVDFVPPAVGDKWTPIGRQADQAQMSFQGIFDGNGRVIRNLEVDYSQQAGLFGHTRDAVIQNLGFDGSGTSITSSERVGVLAGAINRTEVRNVYSTGTVNGLSGTDTGGLIGSATDSLIIAALTTGRVELAACSSAVDANAIGGLVGRSLGTSIIASAATGSIGLDAQGNPLLACPNTGGLVGQALSATESGWESSIEGSYSTGYVFAVAPKGGFVAVTPYDVVSSYWATDGSGLFASAGNPTPATLAQMQEAESADYATGGIVLYEGWDAYEDDDGTPYWDFGDSSELPGLCLGGLVYRDADSDGELEPPVACGATTQNPCAGICENPTSISWPENQTYQSGNLGSGEVCLETYEVVTHGACGNFASGRQLTVNGVQRSCGTGNWAAPPPVNGGHCIQVTAGDYSWAWMALWDEN